MKFDTVVRASTPTQAMPRCHAGLLTKAACHQDQDPTNGCGPPLALTLVACDLGTLPCPQEPLPTALTDTRASGSSAAGRTLARRKKKPNIEFSIHPRVACAYSSSQLTERVHIRCVLGGRVGAEWVRARPRMGVCGAGLQFPLRPWASLCFSFPVYK